MQVRQTYGSFLGSFKSHLDLFLPFSSPFTVQGKSSNERVLFEIQLKIPSVVWVVTYRLF